MTKGALTRIEEALTGLSEWMDDICHQDDFYNFEKAKREYLNEALALIKEMREEVPDEWGNDLPEAVLNKHGHFIGAANLINKWMSDE